jgi:hypothetical protein
MGRTKAISGDPKSVEKKSKGRPRWSWYRRSPLSKDFPLSFRIYSGFYISYAGFALGYILALVKFLGLSRLPGWFFLSYLPFFPMLFVFVLWRIRLDEKLRKEEERPEEKA